MKLLKPLILMGLLFHLQSNAQGDTIIFPGFVNLSTIILGFETFEYEGGDLSYYDCVDCSNNSLPFNVIFNSPGDFGDITFSLNPTSDTIFSGTLVWDGQGEITYPEDYMIDFPFNGVNDISPLPDSIVFYDQNGEITTDNFLTQHEETIWNVIDTLAITNFYSVYNFKVGIHFYAPSWGPLNYSVAKWVVFFYYYHDSPNFLEDPGDDSDIVLFPNPTPSLLNLKADFSDQFKYEIYSIMGECVLKGILSGNNPEIDLSNMSPNLYFLRLGDETFKILKVE